MRGDEPVTVLAHGCFDMLHAGHIEHLLDAGSRGDRLIVSVTSDQYVGKGIGRPHYSAHERASHLRALKFVDEVLINDAPNAIPMIERIRPNVYVKGVDYSGTDFDKNGLQQEIDAVVRCGGRFEATETSKQSSSRILAKWQHGNSTATYLDGCRERGFWPRIEAAFERAQLMKVAFVGETIIDEYRFVTPLGKPSKEYVLAVVADGVEIYVGGVVAAARQVEKMCQVACVTQRFSEIRKTRFVARDFSRKLFEVYSTPRLEIGGQERKVFEDELYAAAREADVIVVLDFGHGLIDSRALGEMRPAKFLAVNAQSNAGNQGYNSAERWQDADYICLDAPEAHLAAQDQYGDVERVIAKVSTLAKHVIVTHGREGAYWCGGHVPAFATEPRDTIGAGDCFLAVTAPLIAAGLGDEESALVGNVAGAMKTEIVGHRVSIDAGILYQSVKSLLK